MTIIDKIRDKKLRCDINREAAKVSALSSGKIDNNEYFTSEEILPQDESRMVKQIKFTYSLLTKAFEKQLETIEKHAEALNVLKPAKQKLSIKDAIPEDQLNEEAKNERENKQKNGKNSKNKRFSSQNK